MSILGTRLTILIGRTVPTPAPDWLMLAFESAEVISRADDRSAFDITFRAGRGGPLGVADYRLMTSELLRVGSRVILIVIFSGRPHVLIDGIVTELILPATSRAGSTTMTIRGEDLGYVMDRKEIKQPRSNLSDDNIVRSIVANYSTYGVQPDVQKPGRPAPQKNGVRAQQETDYAYLKRLAEINGFVFHIEPGGVPGISLAYWGPPKRTGEPQRALSFNVGPSSNVEDISFSYDGMAAAKYTGKFRDRESGEEMSLPEAAPSGDAPLSARPARQADQDMMRERQLDPLVATMSEAQSLADAAASRSSRRVVQATGELDAARYGDVLKPRGLVGLRGAGFSFDGHWYVREVTHVLRQGSYRQRFTIEREGLGSTVATVRV